ncbi:hypothetical protein [Catenovulum sediminis]|uniref:Ubiquitin-activating enzyme E1 FCCH domain-containing protein n=1 Tax=Catenovulum sediminis TaxID=1740262 RepID=A0ABV1RD71_9ALTE
MALDTSKFLGGDGSAGSPYIIHDADALLAIFNNQHTDGSARNKKFILVADIDLTYLPSLSGTSTQCENSLLDGSGHCIYFPYFSPSTLSSGLQLSNVELNFSGGGFSSVSIFDDRTNSQYSHSRFTSVLFSGFLDSGGRLTTLARDYFIDCVANLASAAYITTSTSGTVNYNYVINGTAALSGAVEVSVEDSVVASSYPNLDTENWDISDGLIPTPKLKPYTGLPVTRVAGITKIDGVPTKRRITVQDLNSGRVARMFSDALTGEFSIQTSPHKANLTVIVDDEMGNQIKENTAYALGDIVYPADYVGIVYVCTSAGTTHSELPSSYPTSGDFTSGTAAFSAKPINKPQVFSPVKPEIILE